MAPTSNHLSRRALGIAATALLACAAWPGHAQDYPNKMIRIIVPNPAGGTSDVLGRLLAKELGETLKQPVIVENKGGANGSIGAAEVARSAPDGYTLLATNSSSITVNPLIYKNSQYKAKDFAPIALVLDAPFILNVNPEWAKKHAIESVKDLVDYATKNPGELTYGSGGQGNLAHLAFAQLSNDAQFKATHVPYKSASQASMAVMAGEVNTSFDTLASVPQVAAGKLKALAVTQKQRISQMPDIPTMAEAGFPNIDVTFWLGLFAPAGTPAQIVDTLYEQSKRAMEQPAANTSLSAQGIVVMRNPKELSTRIGHEVDQLSQVVKRENIVID